MAGSDVRSRVNVGKLPAFHRAMRARAQPIAVVTVGYPATPIPSGRVRLCVSAAHTKADIDALLEAVDEVGGAMDLKHGIPERERWSLERVCRDAVQLVEMERVI